MILYKKQKGLYMIKKKCITRCSLSILLFLFSIKSNETILKEIDLQLKAIETTEKKIESIHNFLDESIKKENQQKLEKLGSALNKQKNKLLQEGLGKIKKEKANPSHDEIIQIFTKTFEGEFAKDKNKAMESLINIVSLLDGTDNKKVDHTKKKLEQLILNLNSTIKKRQEKQQVEIIKNIIQKLKELIMEEEN